jgi:NADPH:quinone reductase-like Zn-dependent oxidoreductase
MSSIIKKLDGFDYSHHHWLMKAFLIDRYDRKGGGRLADVPEPVLGDDDVLVQVHAASVNVLDAKIRRGEFKLILPYRFPLILGHDVAGTVLDVGSRARHFKPGDQVFARLDDGRIGAFAERISVKESSLAFKPANLGMAEAASIPLAGLTAWQALVDTAHLQAGQKVLIHAGSGGVGTLAIQLAKHLGAFVATTTSAANVEWVRSLGADLVIDYRNQDFAALLQDYDVVLNTLGSDVLERSLQVLRPGGQLISISGPPTPQFASEQGLGWPLKQVFRTLSYRIRKQAGTRGVRDVFVFMRANGGQLGELASMVEAGHIRPVIDRSYPLASTADALAYVEQGRAKGKVIVNIN